MKMHFALSRVGLLVGLLVSFCTAAAQATSAVRTDGRLKIVELDGSSRERGVQHGRALKQEIAQVVALWQADLEKGAKQPADAFLKEFLGATNFLPAVERWTPGLLDEVRGIAEGSGQSFDTMFAFQLVDEIWVYLNQRNAHHCSGLGVPQRDGRPGFVAQNMDLEPFRDGFQAVLHLRETGAVPEQFIFTCAGLIATNGVNRRGIGLAVNTLMALRASTTGLPVAFVIRGVLACKDGAGAEDFLRRVPHASGQNYILGAGGKVSNFEASAGKVVEMPPAADGTVAHTNHPLVNDDLKSWRLKKPSATDNSPTRLDAVQRRLGQAASSIDENVIRAILRSKDSEKHPVCVSVKPGSGGATFGGVIMTLSNPPVLDVSAGPPDVNPFVRFTFQTAAK